MSTFEKLNENVVTQNETQFRFVQAETTTMGLMTTGASSTLPVEVTTMQFKNQTPVETTTVFVLPENKVDFKFTNQLENTRETSTTQVAFKTAVEQVNLVKIDQPSVQTITELTTVFSVPSKIFFIKLS